jgi:hypothetical protein
MVHALSDNYPFSLSLILRCMCGRSSVWVNVNTINELIGSYNRYLTFRIMTLYNRFYLFVVKNILFDTALRFSNKSDSKIALTVISTDILTL